MAVGRHEQSNPEVIRKGHGHVVVDLNEQALERVHRAEDRARRRAIRGAGYCAVCKHRLKGSKVCFPTASECAATFGGLLDEGDAICFWCETDWLHPDVLWQHGHA
jgi:hypothetical protein